MLIPTAASEENSSLGIPNGVHSSQLSALCCKDMNICKSILTFMNRGTVTFRNECFNIRYQLRNCTNMKTTRFQKPTIPMPKRYFG